MRKITYLLIIVIFVTVLFGYTQNIHGAVNPNVNVVTPTAYIIDSDFEFDSVFVIHNGQHKVGRVWAALELWSDLHVPLMWDGYMENIDTGAIWHISNIQQIVHETEQAFYDNPPAYYTTCWKFYGTDYGYRYHQYTWWISDVNHVGTCELEVLYDTTGYLYLVELFETYSKGQYCCGTGGPLYNLYNWVFGVYS